MSLSVDIKARSTYIIRNVATGKIIDLNLKGRKKITGWASNGGFNQIWTMYESRHGFWQFFNDRKPGDEASRRYLQRDGNYLDSKEYWGDLEKNKGCFWYIDHSPGVADRTKFEISYSESPDLVVEHNAAAGGDGLPIPLRPRDGFEHQMWTFQEVWPQTWPQASST